MIRPKKIENKRVQSPNDKNKRQFSPVIHSSFSTSQLPKVKRNRAQSDSSKIVNSYIPVIRYNKLLEDKQLHEALLSKLAECRNVQDKVKILNEAWTSAMIPLENTKTLIELKEQFNALTGLLTSSQMFNCEFCGHKFDDLKEILDKEKSYSKNVESKLKTLSIENVKLHKKAEKIKNKYNYLIHLSSSLAKPNSSVLKIKDLVNELRHRDETIQELNSKSNGLQIMNENLLRTLDKYEKKIGFAKFERNKNPVFLDIPKDFPHSFEDVIEKEKYK